MQLTIIGAVQVLIGLILFLAGSVEAMFAFLLVATLFGGSAAIVLGSLGTGSSIPPLHFALLFMVLRLLVPGSGQLAATGRAVQANAWLAIFVLYGVLMAYVGPRLFGGRFEFTPLRPTGPTGYTSHISYLLATRPFAPSAQNFTASVYLIGTLVAATAAHVACKAPSGRVTLVRTMAVVGMIHALFVFLSVVGKGTPIDDALGFFRNGSYAQLNQQVDGIVRMSGISTEPSSYAGYGSIWFVFLAECWLRRIEPHLTGLAALVLGTALLASTSTTAYIALGAYGLLVATRSLIIPGAMPADRGLWLAVLGLTGVIAGSLFLLWQPSVADRLMAFGQHLLMDKMSSDSGIQRKFWAMQGLHAFVGTYGIGVGPGSFRSSSLVTAVLGCVGIVGSLALCFHVMIAFKPLRWSTYIPMADVGLATAGACAWALFMAVVIGAITAPSCDPGCDFALLSGTALALRGRSVRFHGQSTRVPSRFDPLPLTALPAE